MDSRVAGLLLAAGAGRRMGTPKALLRHPDGTPWVARAAGALAGGGCAPVLVVLGAAAEQARPLVPEGFRVVVEDGWAEGMAASLRAGLAVLERESGHVEAALVALVDTPDVGPEVVGRVCAGAGRQSLARAVYLGVPGHPVLLGRAHWPGVQALAEGDTGARGYLAGRTVTAVECADLGSGRDVDGPGPGDGLTLGT
jgi:CTP:molybdopterin cytidylyltransferase MocA